MESIYYRIKQPQSVPMYDRVTDSYHILIDDEMIELPKILFDKLFEIQEYQPLTPATDEEVELARPIIKDLFDKFVGPGKPMSVDSVKEMTVRNLVNSNYGTEEEMRELVDELIEEFDEH